MDRMDQMDQMDQMDYFHGNKWIFEDVCGQGDEEAVKLMLARGADDFQNGFISACKNNQINIIKLLISEGKYSDVNYGMYVSCRYSQMSIIRIEIIKLFLSLGANKYADALYGLCQNDSDSDLEIINIFLPFLTEEYVNNYNIKIRRVYNIKENFWNKCFNLATKNNKINVFDLLLSKGAYNFNDGLRNACINGNMELANKMISLEADNFEDGLLNSYTNNKKETFNLMVSLGAYNFDECLEYHLPFSHISDEILIHSLLLLGATYRNYPLKVFIKKCNRKSLFNFYNIQLQEDIKSIIFLFLKII